MTHTDGQEFFCWEIVQDNKLGRAVEFYSLLTPEAGNRSILFRATLPVDTDSNPYFKRRFTDDTLEVIRSLV